MQKSRAKLYSNLNGKLVEAFVGRVPCKFKMVLLEVSIEKKTSRYGDYIPVKLLIVRSYYNGKVLELTVSHLGINHTLKLELAEVEKLTLHMKENTMV